MRKKGDKGKLGKRGRCPRCRYHQKIKTRLRLVCCSNCGNKYPRKLWRIKIN